MWRHLNYLKYVLKHKYYVFLAGRLLNVPLWSLIWHDWDKFLPSMWQAYAHTYYEADGRKRYHETADFLQAWNAHQKRNRHHWQHWLLWDKGQIHPLPMPPADTAEMVADWLGAGWAITGDKTNLFAWYAERQNQLILHPETRATAEKLLQQLQKQFHSEERKNG